MVPLELWGTTETTCFYFYFGRVLLRLQLTTVVQLVLTSDLTRKLAVMTHQELSRTV